jgi:8-oxo-dGTP pyrophosphatase MutT (NUDIX family)
MKLGRQNIREVSAGGLVISSEDKTKVALISHKNRGGRIDWCLPKGHPENNETLEQAAIREVFEETGLEAKIVKKLGTISYRFKVGNKRISKTVHHFLMTQVGGELDASNDPAGEVIDAQWVEIDQLQEVLAHENERRMAQLAQELIDG